MEAQFLGIKRGLRHLFADLAAPCRWFLAGRSGGRNSRRGGSGPSSEFPPSSVFGRFPQTSAKSFKRWSALVGETPLLTASPGRTGHGQDSVATGRGEFKRGKRAVNMAALALNPDCRPRRIYLAYQQFCGVDNVA